MKATTSQSATATGVALLQFLLLNWEWSLADSYFIPMSSNAGDVQFFLYTNSSSGGQIVEQELTPESVSSVHTSSFNKDAPTVLLIHGFWSTRHSHFPTKVRNAYLETSPTLSNYIVVDWGRLAGAQVPPSFENAIYPIFYPFVVSKNIPIVSKRVAYFIQFLIDNELGALGRLHIVGHSLGAHVAGYVGALLQETNGGAKVARITALDPAGPLFDQVIQLQRMIGKGDGEFVDVYHTGMGTRGDSTLDGHVDFYPNGGHVQPPCPQDAAPNLPPPQDIFGKGICSHEFVVDIYAATIRKKLTACQCIPGEDLLGLDKCLLECPGRIYAGERCPPTARGVYYFRTGTNP